MDEAGSNSNQIVIDLGADTTSLAFFYNDTICGSEIIPIGGKSITKDVAFGLNISFTSAERLKNLHGAAFVSIDDDHDMILVPVIEDDNVIDLQQIPKSSLNHIIQYRIEEILKIVKMKIEESIFSSDFSKSNVILTGGGSNLTGIKDFAVGILNKKVTIKKLHYDSAASNIQIYNSFAVAIGMIKFAQSSDVEVSSNKLKRTKNNTNFIKKTLNWIESNL
jgi:cell division protein FtsA